MIQIVKHSVEPIKAMMRSNAGKMMEMITKIMMTAMRITTLRIPRVYSDWAVKAGDSCVA